MYIFIFAEDCISFLCGNKYLDAVTTLRILICCIVPLVLTNLFGNQILIPSGNEKRYSQSVFVGMWINLGLNVLMIPTMGSVGAAIGTLITELWNVIWMSCGAKDYRKMLIRSISYKIYLVSLVIAVLLSLGLAYLIKFNFLFWKLSFAAVIFFGTYYFILLLVKEPIITGQFEYIVKCISKDGKQASHNK